MSPEEVMKELIDKGNSKYKIAQVMGMHPIMVDNFITGKVKTIRRDAADRLANYFDVAVNDKYINGLERKQLLLVL